MPKAIVFAPTSRICPLMGMVVDVFTATGILADRGRVLAVRGTFEKHHLLIHSNHGRHWHEGDRCLLAATRS